MNTNIKLQTTLQETKLATKTTDEVEFTLLKEAKSDQQEPSNTESQAFS